MNNNYDNYGQYGPENGQPFAQPQFDQQQNAYQQFEQPQQQNVYQQFDQQQAYGPQFAQQQKLLQQSFWRWESWSYHFNQKRFWGALGILSFVLVLFLAGIVIGAFFIASIPYPDKTTDNTFFGWLTLVILSVYFFIWTILAMSYFSLIFSANTEEKFHKTIPFLKAITFLNPAIMFIVLASINNHIDGPDLDEVAQKMWKETIALSKSKSYAPGWAQQTNTFALTGAHTGQYQDETIQQPLMLESQETEVRREEVHFAQPQQPTGAFNVPPRGPQQPYAPNPYAQPQQPTGAFNVPPRGPQTPYEGNPNFQNNK